MSSKTVGTTLLFYEFHKQKLIDMENEVTINGKTYHAKPRHEKQEGGIRHRLCCECAMMSLRKSHNIQNACSLVKCMADERMDKKSVIFV